MKIKYNVAREKKKSMKYDTLHRVTEEKEKNSMVSKGKAGERMCCRG